MMPLVSVLLLTYNHKNYIKQALNSVLSQNTTFNFEILIGDDCSTDGTTEIVKEIAAQNPNKIKLIQDDKNVGALRNEKRLFEAATGKYIAFLEGDDYWMDDLKLQKQVDFLEANPGYGMVHSDVDHYYERTGQTVQRVNTISKIKIPEGDIFNDLMKPNPFFIKTATVCFRKELIVKYFDYDLAINEYWPLTDFPLWLDITYHSKAHYFNEVFATYRLLNESASVIISPQKKYKYHIGLHKIKQFYCNKYNCTDAVRKKIEEVYHRGIIKIAFNMNDHVIAKTSLNYLKENKFPVDFKERLMVAATKYKMIKSIIKMLK